MTNLNRYRKLASVASELLRMFSIQDIYVIMRRIDRLYPWWMRYNVYEIDALEVQYDCYARCWLKARDVNAANALLSLQDRWPYME